MRILKINKFLYPKGGDAICTLNTGNLLSAMGHNVIYWGMEHSFNPEYEYEDYFVSNIDYHNTNSIGKRIKAATSIFYSFEARDKIEKLINREKPDIAHSHNFAHQISPSILHVFRKYRIPTVMTMHDYKLVCASYAMLENGRICEACKGGRYYQCFLKSCVKDSRAKSMLNTAEMYLHHKMLHIYDLIDVFISPSQFLKGKVEEMGFKGKVVHLPNFVSLKNYQPRYDWRENSIVYVGRLSQEKGLFALIETMKRIPEITLKIIGEGPLRESLELRVRSSELKNVRFLGYKTGEELKEEIKKSMFLVIPSEWYENNPFSILEAFALGKPVIGSRIGGIPELVKDGVTGLTFEPGNVEDLRSKIEYMLANPDKVVEMGKNARKLVEEEYNAEKHYQGLMEIYKRAINENNLS